MKTSRSEDFRRKILFRTNVFRFIVFFKLEVFHSLDFQQQQLHIKIEKKIDFFGGRFFFRFVTLFVSGPTGKKDSRPKLFSGFFCRTRFGTKKSSSHATSSDGRLLRNLRQRRLAGRRTQGRLLLLLLLLQLKQDVSVDVGPQELVLRLELRDDLLQLDDLLLQFLDLASDGVHQVGLDQVLKSQRGAIINKGPCLASLSTGRGFESCRVLVLSFLLSSLSSVIKLGPS